MSPSDEIRFFFAAASPRRRRRISVTHELETIQELVPKQKLGPRIMRPIEVHPEVTLDIFRTRLKEAQPVLVHFAGHGEQGGLVMSASGSKRGQVVPADVLGETLSDAGVEVLVLNACHSMTAHEDLERHVDVLIGTTGAVDDDEAAKFAIEFYRAFTDEATALEAFDFAMTFAAKTGVPNVFTRRGNRRYRLGHDHGQGHGGDDEDNPTRKSYLTKHLANLKWVEQLKLSILLVMCALTLMLSVFLALLGSTSPTIVVDLNKWAALAAAPVAALVGVLMVLPIFWSAQKVLGFGNAVEVARLMALDDGAESEHWANAIRGIILRTLGAGP